MQHIIFNPPSPETFSDLSLTEMGSSWTPTNFINISGYNDAIIENKVSKVSKPMF